MRVAVYQRINSKSKRFDEVGQKIHYDYFFANHPNLTLVNIYSDTEDSRDIPAFRELLKEFLSKDRLGIVRFCKVSPPFFRGY